MTFVLPVAQVNNARYNFIVDIAVRAREGLTSVPGLSAPGKLPKRVKKQEHSGEWGRDLRLGADNARGEFSAMNWKVITGTKNMSRRHSSCRISRFMSREEF